MSVSIFLNSTSSTILNACNDDAANRGISFDYFCLYWVSGCMMFLLYKAADAELLWAVSQQLSSVALDVSSAADKKDIINFPNYKYHYEATTKLDIRE